MSKPTEPLQEMTHIIPWNCFFTYAKNRRHYQHKEKTQALVTCGCVCNGQIKKCVYLKCVSTWHIFHHVIVNLCVSYSF